MDKLLGDPIDDFEKLNPEAFEDMKKVSALSQKLKELTARSKSVRELDDSWVLGKLKEE